MSRLFLRIWLANWLAFALVVLSSIFIFHQYIQGELRQRITNPPPTLDQLKNTLLKAVEDGENLQSLVLRLSETWRSVYLIDASGKDIAGRELPTPHLSPPWSRASGMGAGLSGYWLASAGLPKVKLPGYPEFQLMSFTPPGVGKLRRLSLLTLIGLAFLASGLVAVILARFIALPIKQLYLASERVAAGDFQINVAASVGNRKDEIADLARRFDQMAKALDSAQSNQKDLLRDVSHELRSPLTRLLLISDMMDKSAAGDENTFHKRLKKELNELETLIDEVMALARYELESGKLFLQRCDLRFLLEPLIDDAKFEADAVNKTVTFVYSNEGYEVNVASLYFSRAVDNILRNAIRHTPDNSEVEIRLSKDAQNTYIAITDSGDGVKDEELTKIFSPFYRSAAARARTKGTGIGLALVERIVTSHSGRILAENCSPKGLRITVVLPSA